MAGVDQKWNDNIFGQKCQCVRKKGASYLWLGVPRKVRGEICTIFAHTPCNGLQPQWSTKQKLGLPGHTIIFRKVCFLIYFPCPFALDYHSIHIRAVSS